MQLCCPAILRCVAAGRMLCRLLPSYNVEALALSASQVTAGATNSRLGL